MPVSSISSLNSWGVYIVSAVAIVLMLTPQLTALARASRESADWRYLDGVRTMLDSLEPGVAVNLTSPPGFAPDPVHLGGHQMSTSYGTGTLVFNTTWALPSITISPSSNYRLCLCGGEVVVTRIG